MDKYPLRLEKRIIYGRRRQSTDVIQSGDGVAADGKTVDEVAGDDEWPSKKTGQTARCSAERAQTVDLFRHTVAVQRRRTGRTGLMEQSDSEMREEAIQRVWKTEIRTLDTHHDTI